MITYGTLPFILYLSALSAAIIAAHALTVFAADKHRRIVSPIGIALHLLTLLLFLFTVDSDGEAMALESVVLFFIISALVYTALFFVKEQLDKRSEREDDEESESEVADA